jgi:2-haloacid dehalogenase
VTRVLFFDVFGTVVDWRSGIRTAFETVARSHPDDGAVRSADWAAITDEWRRAYPGVMQAAREASRSQGAPWQDLDRLQSRTLDDVLAAHEVDLPPAARDELVSAWRRLPPWPDSRDGMDRLRRRFTTATLSNGHVALLVDLLRFADLRVDAVLSAQCAASYKPDPAVYLHAAELLECPPDQAAMVAAHGSDLEAAAALGFRPVFVRRPDEWGPEAVAAAPPDLPGLVVVDRLGDVADALR